MPESPASENRTVAGGIHTRSNCRSGSQVFARGVTINHRDAQTLRLYIEQALRAIVDLRQVCGTLGQDVVGIEPRQRDLVFQEIGIRIPGLKTPRGGQG